MSSKKVIILTNSHDAHADLIGPKIIGEGGECIRIDTDRLDTHFLINLYLNGKNKKYKLKIPLETLDLGKVYSLWIRRPYDFPNIRNIKEKLTSQEIMDSIDSLIIDLFPSKARIIHPPEIIKKASRKITQLRNAQIIGLKIPRTLVTNSPVEAKDFFKLLKFNVVTKSLGKGHAVMNRKFIGIYTTKVTKDMDFASVRNCPTLFQEEIIKKTELRITIIGRKIFAVEFDSQLLPKAKIDWRKEVNNIKKIPHRVVQLPHIVENQLLSLLNYYGLKFGAIDMAKTPEGEYIFFELNPAGQFLWLEDLTGLPLASEMAKFLLGRK